MGHDYDLSRLEKIKIRGFQYYIMPRYKQHYLTNEYEPFSTAIIKNNLEKNSNFVDIGAHYGYFSLVASEKAKKVYALEPVPENNKILNKNIQLNRLKNVEVHQLAASDKSGEAEFNIPWASDSAGFYEHPNAASIRKIAVKTLRLDEMFANKKIDFIKIDTEGHEIAVLDGLEKTIKNNKPKLLIEFNPRCLMSAGHSPEDLLTCINKLGYETFVVNEDSFRLDRITGKNKSWKNILGEEGYSNILCIPSRKQNYFLFISHSPYRGGAEMGMVEQILALRKINVNSHVVLPGPGGLQKILRDRGISHSIIDSYTFWSKPQGRDMELKLNYQNRMNAKAAVKILEIARVINPTAIVNNTIAIPWGFYAAKILNLKLVWMIHEFGDIDHGINFGYPIRLIRDFIVAKSDVVITCSDAVKKSLVSSKDSKKKVFRIYYPLSEEEIKNLSKEKIIDKYSQKMPVISIIGMISPGKGQEQAIRAIYDLKKQGKKYQLLIVGRISDRSYYKKIKKMINDLNLQNDINIINFLENPYLIIAQSEALLVCSRNEAFGRVTAEAMIIGTPVIATNSGGSIEMIQDRKTGFLFKHGNSNELSSKILELEASNKAKIIKNAKIKISKLIDSEKNLEELNDAVLFLERKNFSNLKNQTFSKILLEELMDALKSFIDYESEALILKDEIKLKDQHIRNLDSMIVTQKETAKEFTPNKPLDILKKYVKKYLRQGRP